MNDKSNTTSYNVTGMTCAACSAHVEKAVGKVDGVSAVSVSLLTNSMTVEGGAPEAVISAVEKAGYGAAEKGAEKNDPGQTAGEGLTDSETPRLKKRLIASLCLLAPLVYISMGSMMWGWPRPAFLSGVGAVGLYELLLTTAIMAVNQKFFVSGFAGAIHGAPNMDTLVALGAGASYGYSVYALFAAINAAAAGNTALADSFLHEYYFESAAMILTLITVGKLLEAHSKGRTTDALKSLIKLAPKTARVFRNGVEETVAAETLVIGDIFTVRPGESFPADGTVLEGEGAVDESALTGESIPVDKAPGSQVSAATINASGFLKCRAVRVGQDTSLSNIIRMVTDAAATKAPIARVADRVSGVFVPVVLGIAAVTVLIWLLAGQTAGFALARGISVLVISCPCALGLATPVAIMVGSGVGAKRGILFKTAVSLEKTGRTEIVALDKTGTVTEGRPAVTDVLPANGIDENALFSAALALEVMSEHPLAKAITQYGKEKGISAPRAAGFKAVAGSGLTGSVDGKTIWGGKLDFIRAYVDIDEAVVEKASELAAQGKTPLYFAEEGRLLGVVAVADTIKAESPQAVEQLKNMGVRVVMLTGDNALTAKAIGRQAGLDNVVADVLPQGKESAVRRLAGAGAVAMVGDGINDAPALTRADTGIAIGAGTDVAIDAADVVLMKSRLTDVPAAIRLSRAVLRNIHENLFLAFFYNIIGIPLAAGVWFPAFGIKLSPMFGALAMSLSSFCVVMNALRLNLVDIYNPAHDHKTKVKRSKKAMEKTLVIEGMMCAHCEARVKKALEALENVQSAQLSHTAGTAVVTLSAAVEDSVLKSAVEAQDYKVLEIR